MYYCMSFNVQCQKYSKEHYAIDKCYVSSRNYKLKTITPPEQPYDNYYDPFIIYDKITFNKLIFGLKSFLFLVSAHSVQVDRSYHFKYKNKVIEKNLLDYNIIICLIEKYSKYSNIYYNEINSKNRNPIKYFLRIFKSIKIIKLNLLEYKFIENNKDLFINHKYLLKEHNLKNSKLRSLHFYKKRIQHNKKVILIPKKRIVDLTNCI